MANATPARGKHKRTSRQAKAMHGRRPRADVARARARRKRRNEAEGKRTRGEKNYNKQTRGVTHALTLGNSITRTKTCAKALL